MTKYLLALLIILLPTSAFAQAALTFGVVPSADFMVQSVPQAQRFAAYLEKRLEEPVAIRIFSSDDELRNALEEEHVDLAAVKGSDLAGESTSAARPKSAEVFVIRSGLEAGLRARLKEVLAAMEQDPEGQILLYGMRLRRFSPANGTKSRQPVPSVKPVSQRRNTSGFVSTGKPGHMASRGFGNLTLGVVADRETPLRSLEAAKDFAGKLSRQLKSRVAVQTFDDEITLYDWFKRYRMIDLALYSQKFLQDRFSGDFKYLAQPADLVDQGLPAETCLVTRPGLAPRLLDRLNISLEQIKGAPLVAQSTRTSGAGPVKGSVSAVSPEGIHQVPPSHSMALPATFTASSSGGGKYTFGVALTSGALLRNEEQARAFAGLLGARLDARVTTKTFKDTETLHEWLSRYRMVDVGFMNEAYLKKQPAGEFTPLLTSGDLGGPAGFRLVGRQGLDKESLGRIQDSLQQMKNDSKVAGLLRGGIPDETSDSVTPSTVIAVQPAPSLVEPEPAIEPTIIEPEPQPLPEPKVSTIASQPEPLVSSSAVQPESIIEPHDMESAKQLEPEVAAAPVVSQPEPLVSTPVTVQPTSAPLVVEPEVVVVPMAAPVVSIAPPVKQIAIPSKVEPEPVVGTPATGPEPQPEPEIKVATLASQPEPLIPAPATQPESTIEPSATESETQPEPEIAASAVGSRPKPPEGRFSPAMNREQIFIAPFITIMVPLQVENEVFDNFVDDLNAGDMGERYELIILKKGLDSVDENWLAQHTYITGEIFGYVEESGCCSTDIRTKSRVFLFRKGNPVPVMQHEYPVQTFFDHDYSTIEQERRKLAENIATELATKVREALGGA